MLTSLSVVKEFSVNRKLNIGVISKIPKLTLSDDDPGGGGVLPQILDRGVPRRFLNPNPI